MKIDLLDKGFIELVDHMGNDARVVEAARVSFLGKSKGEEQDNKLLHYLMEHKHTGPFEHVVFTFRIKCPLFVRSQWHRSRTWSFNEISRRYTSEEMEFYMPGEWRAPDKLNKQGSTDIIDSQTKITYLDETNIPLKNSFEHHVLTSESLYDEMLEAGVAREMARMVLPQNMYTMFWGTVNLHNLLHFLELRTDTHAQYEIRIYADAILKLIEPIVPVTIAAWKKHNANFKNIS